MSTTSLEMHKCTFFGCSKEFMKQSKLTRHFNTHLNDRPFQCTEINCLLTYTRKEHLSRHQKSHCSTLELQKPFACKICTSRFDTLYHLKRHSKIHSVSPLFPCMECDSSFNKHFKLQEHMQSHSSNPEVYQCQECLKDYPSQQKLSRHLKKHSTLKSYLCGFVGCMHAADKWTHLQQHVKLVHPPTCHICQKVFSKNEGLKGHQKTTGHGKCLEDRMQPRTLFHCIEKNCEKVFRSLKSMNAHSKKSHGQNRNIERKNSVNKMKIKSSLVDEKDKTEKLETSMVKLLTGCGIECDENRKLSCPVTGCDASFFRMYDCHRHIKSRHPDGQLVDPLSQLLPVF